MVEINREGLVKPSDLVYTRCSLAWDTYLQIMENSEAKSLSLSSNVHRRFFLNIIHGQTIENTKYEDILDTTCLKHHRFDSLSSNIFSKFFNVIYKKFVSEIDSNMHASEERMKKDDKPNKQSAKIKKL